ncbi:hypothetical protein KsCSTR_16180 [Candidatus Kuenenia stuttgartiensis]|uniref:Uncharacterized protein n=1 Tax=Kuenenia stuttgartiensis TaxID=174633 RepID=A0A6G7GN30_KUEST|nr:hypothetical protein KsCSTR_16180 [Candidatus Kuenenia stuttgartiensis]
MTHSSTPNSIAESAWRREQSAWRRAQRAERRAQGKIKIILRIFESW